nr:hypothetical protein [Tanacetum cinerariifolium]
MGLIMGEGDEARVTREKDGGDNQSNMLSDVAACLRKLDVRIHTRLEDVLENRPYKIPNVPIVLKKWSRNMSLVREDLTKGQGSFARTLIELDATCGPVVKPKSTTLIFISFSNLEEDHGNYMDDLVDDTRKKVEAPPRKTGIWDGLEFVNMDQVVEVAEHGNVPREHG